MSKKDFDNLVTSIRQAGRIRRGEIKPNWVTQFAPRTFGQFVQWVQFVQRGGRG